ncbi:MAG: DUF5058 family protein [Oscillospiraceae bacterium]|nr:DUF5058 family protein [Oscillospiraceae bacterium]
MMSEEVKAVANSPVLWLITASVIALLITQSLLIRKRTKDYVLSEHIMTEDEISTATKTGIFATIGPAVAVFILAMSFVNLLGAPMTLLRIGIVGSAGTEIRSATAGALVAGVALGNDELTMPAFGAAQFACAFMTTGYFIMVPVYCLGFGKLFGKWLSPKSDKDKMPLPVVLLTKGFPVAYFSWMIYMQIKASKINAGVICTAVVAMFVLDYLAQNTKAKWLGNWTLGFAVMIGMASSLIWKGILA